MPLRSDLHAIYHPVAQEIEAHTTIMGITLNDAFGEREAHRREMAWLVVGLAEGEWERLRELVVGLLDTLANYLPTTNVVVPVRRVSADNFKSRPVMDIVGLYEFLDQVLFSSKQRYSLRLRVLSRTCAMLSKEFRRTCHEGARAQDSSPEVWSRLDSLFPRFRLDCQGNTSCLPLAPRLPVPGRCPGDGGRPPGPAGPWRARFRLRLE